MFRKLYEKKRGEAEGFTLVELLVVIVILGILAAVVVFAVGGIGDKGQTSACKADVSALSTAEEAYFAHDDAGIYVDETDLAPGFIHEASSLHDISVATDGSSYSIVEDAANATKCPDAP
jgi:general secretion pathway protein G